MVHLIKTLKPQFSVEQNAETKRGRCLTTFITKKVL